MGAGRSESGRFSTSPKMRLIKRAYKKQKSVLRDLREPNHASTEHSFAFLA